MDNMYKTSDFNLACFLYAHGLLYKRIECENPETTRCTFVFEVPTSISLVELLAQRQSSDTDFLRTVLYKNKVLKTELKKYLAFQKLM